MKKIENKAELNKSMSNFIRELRIEQKLTQSQLAEKLEIDTQHLAKIENLKKNVTLDMFLAVCNLFEIDAIAAFTIVYHNYEKSLNSEFEEKELYFYKNKLNNLNVSKKAFILEMIDKLSKI